jgi:hypothetical protein
MLLVGEELQHQLPVERALAQAIEQIVAQILLARGCRRSLSCFPTPSIGRLHALSHDATKLPLAKSECF